MFTVIQPKGVLDQRDQQEALICYWSSGLLGLRERSAAQHIGLSSEEGVRYGGSSCITNLLLFPGTAFSESNCDPSQPRHNMRQTKPIPMGVSGGNAPSIASGPKPNSVNVCGGTLGALVKDGSGTRYILSNNHVLVSGNFNWPFFGRELPSTTNGLLHRPVPIVHPGRLDNAYPLPTDYVGTLFRFKRVEWGNPANPPVNTMDAAIARAAGPSTIDPSGRILDIGIPNSSTVAPAAGMLVKKSGRTTGLTFGRIVSTIFQTTFSRPRYTCGNTLESPGQRATFVNLIRIEPNTAKGTTTFLAGGDSGSLIVEDVNNLPRPVGLLFGEITLFGVVYGLAIPIDTVLNKFGMTIVGGSSMSGFLRRLSRVREAWASDFELAMSAFERHAGALLRIPGVVGVDISKEAEQFVILVAFNKERGERTRVPQTVDGVRIVIGESSDPKFD